MTSAVVFCSVTLVCVMALMLVELLVSRSNERALRLAGAVDAPDQVYRTMRWAYPAAFVAMAIEGVIRVSVPGRAAMGGIAIFVLAKALKAWAIASLGTRWTFRVLVLPGAPLVTNGPYAAVRHPNYVAVIGELLGMAMMTGALVTGPVATLCFAWLLQRRIAEEERALGMRSARH